MFCRNYMGLHQTIGMGFGFRGGSPSWPYLGKGRGGSPRCGYFSRGAFASAARSMKQMADYKLFSVPKHREEELSYLVDQAKAIKEQLKNIESRMQELEVKK